MVKPRLKLVIEADSDAVEIGNLYKRTGPDAILNWWLCGDKLLAKKIALEGGWLQWLSDNETVLGFGELKARRLILLRVENQSLANDIPAEEAERLIRNLWGHKRKDSELIQQSVSNEHYTPEEYIEAAREVLGEIDLDPASCEEANKVVKATVFFDKNKNGLMESWHGRVWLNPPYGEWPAEFIGKLEEEMEAGNVTAAIVLVNAHCTDTIWFRGLWDGILCFTDHRINFYGDEERSGSTHGSVFVYFGDNKERFGEVFSQFGAVVARV